MTRSQIETMTWLGGLRRGLQGMAHGPKRPIGWLLILLSLVLLPAVCRAQPTEAAPAAPAAAAPAEPAPAAAAPAAAAPAAAAAAPDIKALEDRIGDLEAYVNNGSRVSKESKIA